MQKTHLVSLVLAILLTANLHPEEKSREELNKEKTHAILEACTRLAEFYIMEEDEDIKEMTQTILKSRETTGRLKEHILTKGRRFFLFKYPSDGHKVKGCISFTPSYSENPLLIFLRGGNGIFGLPHLANVFNCIRDYTVVFTAYRGGVSEGVDEFGGSEVNDVDHLIQYLPTLATKLQLKLQPKNIFMLGESRGAMEMFLALGRSISLQQQITKVASLSGILDLQVLLQYRADMRKFFINELGLIPNQNEEKWIEERNPTHIASKIRKDLPILIIQGTQDLRVSLDEGNHMLQKLNEHGNCVEYLEIPGGNHCLANIPNRIDLIADWFEK